MKASQGRSLSLSPARAWNAWIAIAAAAFSVHVLTIRLSPIVWKDEVQIVDLGRTVFAGVDSGWGINWLSEGRLYFSSSYLGPAAQEMALRLSAGSMVGPRVSAVLGALFASSAMLAWLLRRGVIPLVALATSLLFLLDPMMVQSYRGGRVDALAMGFMFLAFATLRRKTPATATGNFDPTCALAGIFVGLALISWPSALLLLPLLAYELISRSNLALAPLRQAATVLTAALHVVGFASVTIVMSLLPIEVSGTSPFADILGSGGKTIAVIEGSRLEPAFWAAGVTVLFRCFEYSPWLPLVAVGLLLHLRYAGIALVTVLVLAAILYTRAYFYRVIYLLPYLLMLIAIGMTHLLSGNNVWKRKFVLSTLILLTAWATVVSLGARTSVALAERGARDPTLVDAIAKDSVGEGGYRVYVGSWNFYYAGRRLGWRMFKSFDGIDEKDSPDWRRLLRTMDYVVFDVHSAPPFLDATMRDLGFHGRTFNSSAYATSQLDAVRDAGKGYVTNWVVYESPLRRQTQRPPG